MFGLILSHIAKAIIMSLAEDAVKDVVKGIVKKQVTSKTKTDFDDGLVDVIFDSTTKGELARNVIEYGTDKLLDAVDDGIDNSTVNSFLNKAKQSNGNGVTSKIQNNLKVELKRTENKLLRQFGI